MNNRLFILQGLPGSGKSTFARNLEKTLQHKNIVRVSSDDIRLSCLPKGMFHESEVDDKGFQNLVNHHVWDTVHADTKKWLSHGADVIIDATNIKREWWKTYLQYRSEEIKLVGIQIHSEKDKAIENDLKRLRQVGCEVIERMFDELEPIGDYPEDFDQIIKVNYP